MTVSPLILLAAALLPGISGYYFYLGRELGVGCRLLVSMHGLLALTIVPVGVFIDAPVASRIPALGGVAMLFVSALTIASVVYSIVVLPKVWPRHLLHTLTIFMVLVSVLLGGFVCCGH